MVYLEAKHYCLWRAIKKEVPGCETIEANNPRTGGTVKKYGYRYDTVTGIVVKLLKYDTASKYSTRYFGFKLHMADGPDTYVIDMPYQSQLLRRFLKVARGIDWTKALSITVFKGKKENSQIEPTGIWFQQNGVTIKPYYTREQPHGMPAATHDKIEDQWDFREQHRWLVARLIEETIPDVDAAAAKVAPPIEPHGGDDQADEPPDPPEHTGGGEEITDDDVPF
jgi:hypothetical protein